VQKAAKGIRKGRVADRGEDAGEHGVKGGGGGEGKGGGGKVVRGDEERMGRELRNVTC